MISLILSAIAFLFLFVLSIYITFKERSVPNIALSFATFSLALIEIFDQLSLNLSHDPFIFKRGVIILESLLPVTFLFFSMTYSRQRSVESISWLWYGLIAIAALIPVNVFLFPINDFFYSPDLQAEKILFLGTVGYWFYMGLMIYCVMVLMNLETTFSATSGADRWRMKFEVIGLMGILSVLIFYFSQGLLYRTINMNLMIVKSGVLIVASLLIGYSRLFRGNGVRVAVSRYIFYRSLTLLMVGLYLLILGLIGEGMRYFGIPFSRDITIFVSFASAILMSLLLFSEQMRRKVKVLINKHFFTHKHDYRSEWLNFTERLALCRTIVDIENEILATYRRSFGLKAASLYLLNKEKNRYRLVANYEMPGNVAEIQASPDLIAYFTRHDRVFNPLDDEYVAAEEEASFVQKTGAMLIVPLAGNGNVEGMVVFGGQLTKEEFTYEDYDLMKTLAKQATLSIINFRLSEELAENREIAAVAKISSFVIHDLKNLTSTLSLLLDNAKDYIGDPEFQKDMIEAIRNTLNKMNRLMQRLKTIPEKQTLNTGIMDLHIIVKETLNEVFRSKPGVEVLDQGLPVMAMVDTEEIKKVILNLMLNAMEAIGERGTVKVETGMNGGNVYVRVHDNGCGMTEEFINNHLFKPFRTTKKKGLGIGLYQCKQIVEAHGGTIEVNSKAGEGSVFTVSLPITIGSPDGKAVNY